MIVTSKNLLILEQTEQNKNNYRIVMILFKVLYGGSPNLIYFSFVIKSRFISGEVTLAHE